MEINLPQQPRIVSETGNRTVFEIDGLFPGYGHTIGNAIRRVLLSSLEGAAITAIKIEGVQHEFTTIPGVLEDMVQVMLNLKQVRFRMHGQGPYVANLAFTGEKRLTAGDIQNPSQLEVVNPDQHIATLTDKKADLKMEITVERGIGYQPVESRQKEKVEIGTIALDAAFSPLRLVNVEVENMRVGDRTDYHRIRLTIETDGSITPREAFSQASGILADQFKALAGMYEDVSAGAESETAEGSSITSEASDMPSSDDESFEEQVLRKRVEDLELSTRTLNALVNAGLKNVGAISKKSEERLKELEGLGDTGIIEIKKALGNLGLTLKP